MKYKKSFLLLICGIVYFMMFPAGYKVACFIHIWKIRNKEELIWDYGMWVDYLWLLTVGVLAALFIMAIMAFHKLLKDSASAGKWISLGIIVGNIVLCIISMFWEMFPGMFGIFGYIWFYEYCMLIIMALIFVITDIFCGSVIRKMISKKTEQ